MHNYERKQEKPINCKLDIEKQILEPLNSSIMFSRLINSFKNIL